ncbi:MAG: redox-sensing transcriptional repressor Rex [Candidatus Hydrogenedentes bacterium]|nr:redox-sensing transcriptional repressor Rex [Candidatus Hydrogenedentota bacterium]
MASNQTIGRLSLYRRLLHGLQSDGVRNVYSHQLARLAGATAAQVRRDIMVVGYSGSAAHGYEVGALMESIGQFLDTAPVQRVALVGVGNLGRALLAHFVGRHHRFSIVAAFDVDTHKTGRVIHGCRCHTLAELGEVLAAQEIRIAMLAVPPGEAQETANRLVDAGVTGILNFAPVRLWAPRNVYVEDMDVTMALERVAYHAGNHVHEKERVT